MYQTKAEMSTVGRGNWPKKSRPIRSALGRSAPFGGGGAHLGHMAHLAARPRRALAIEVNGRAGNGQPLLVIVNLVPDQVGHGHLAVAQRFSQGPARDGADMLLELRDRG